MTDVALLRALKALAHPTRFRIVQEIAAAGELSCGQLGDRFHLAQPTMSHHCKLLADAQVIRVRREGQHSILSVDRARIAKLLGALPETLAPARPRGRRGARPKGATP
jgi:ArsR family transcriptional regulator